jgi:arginase
MILQAILVPYDVERQDTNSARGPRELLARGFRDRLREAGWEVHQTVASGPGEGASKAETVAGVGRGIAREVALARSQERFPLVLSGGCLSAVGTVTGLQRSSGDQVGVVWIDAHGDFNTPESTTTGYWDGMSLAALCGRSLAEVCTEIGLRPLPVQNVLHLAGRDFDPPEIEAMHRLGLTAVPPDQMHGEPALERLRRHAEGREIYLHVDMDGLDPRDAPAVSFPVPGGPSLEDLLRCMAVLSPPAALTISALDFERVDDEGAARTIGTCLRLIETLP